MELVCPPALMTLSPFLIQDGLRTSGRLRLACSLEEPFASGVISVASP